MRPGSMATSGLNLIVTRSLEFPELSSSDSAFIERIWSTSSIIPSVKRNPVARSRSEPGERMVIESGEPFRQSCKGSSIASKSVREEDKPLSTVWTWAVIVSPVIVFKSSRACPGSLEHEVRLRLGYRKHLLVGL